MPVNQLKAPAYPGIDLAKFVASILVVCIHTAPLEALSQDASFILIQGIARIAVPYFFVAAGFLFFHSLEKRGYKLPVLGAYLGRILGVYFVWSLLYLFLPIDIRGPGIGKFEDIPTYLYYFFFLGTRYHFWYFPALILSTTLLFFLVRVVKIEVLLGLGVLLYLFCCLGDSYYALSRNPLLSPPVDLWIQYFSGTKNLLPGGFLFVCLGFFVAKKKPSFNLKVGLPLFFFSVALVVVESLVLRELKIAADHNSGILLVPATLLFFLVTIAWTPKRAIQIDYAFLRNSSLLIYVVHPTVLYGLQRFSFTGIPLLLGAIVLCLVFSWVVLKTPWKPMKYLY